MKTINIMIAIFILNIFMKPVLCSVSIAFDPDTLKEVDIFQNYKWNINDIYSSWDQWEIEYNELDKMIDEFAMLKGTISKSSNNLYQALVLIEEVNAIAYKVYFYPYMILSVVQTDEEASKRIQMVLFLFSKWDNATSWFKPDIIAIPEDKMKKWISNDFDLNTFSHYINKMYHENEHILDEEKERLLSYYTRFSTTPKSIYTLLSGEAPEYPSLYLSNGEQVNITPDEYSKILKDESRNQLDRKNVFIEYNKNFTKNKNTFAGIYNAVCQRDWANAQAHGYSSSLEATLFKDKIALEIYENLITLVKSNTEPLHRYMKLRKRIIMERRNLSEYWVYDQRFRFTDFGRDYSFEHAKKWVFESVAPLGKEYQMNMKKGLSDGWIDVFGYQGKTENSFCIGVYGVHPYVLLNYNSTLNSVFSLAHEMGHAVHTKFSFKNQPFLYARPVLFTAEVASLFNERLLLDYLLNTIEDPRERIVVLQGAIEEFINDFYNATLLADFEFEIHRIVEKGEAVTAEILTKKMIELEDIYYGNFSKSIPEFQGTYWISMNHFYEQPFYVFKYATCYVSAVKIYADITNAQTEEARDRIINKYLTFLKSGSYDYPMEILLKAGVDLTKPAIYEAVFEQFGKLVTQLEIEYEKLGD